MVAAFYYRPDPRSPLTLDPVTAQMPTRPESLQQIRPRLEAIAGVQHVAIDDAQPSVVLVCVPDASSEDVTTAAREALSAGGFDADEIQLHVTVRLSQRENQRVRFLGVERGPRPDHLVDLTVRLQWQDRTVSASVESERAEPLELRAVAQAAMEALRKIVPEPLDLKVAGVKQVRSFDAELLVASLYRPGQPPQQYVGAVLVGGDPHRAAAVAVLSALNRMLGNYLDR